MKKKTLAFIIALALALSLAACGSAKTGSESASSETVVTENPSQTASVHGQSKKDAGSQKGADTQSGASEKNSSGSEGSSSAANSSVSALDASDLFSTRDLEQEADLSEAVYITVKSGEDINITEAGVYVISGTAKETTIIVEAGDEDKVQLVLDGVSITNSDFPCIYVKNADKVFVTTAKGSNNTLTVSGTFASDGDTKTDAVIFSKDDLVLNGLGTLNVNSSDNGISGKDDLKITGGTLVVSSKDCGIEANDSIRIYDGTVTVNATNDALHSENDDDQSLGYVYIGGGTLKLAAGDDGVHATTICQIDGGTLTISAAEGIEATWVQINGGDIYIASTDDGVNAARKSTACSVLFEMNGGTLTVKMGQGDTDAIDSNGNIIINGGTIDITGQSSFDYDGTAQYNGGTIIVNGQTTNTITNQFMGGGMGGMQPGGNQGTFPGGTQGQGRH